MRLLNSTSFNQQTSINAMLKQQEALAKTQLQLSTGKKFLVPSDDPIAAKKMIDLQKGIDRTEQYQRNLGMVQDKNIMEETALNGVEEAIFRLKELAVQAKNSTLALNDKLAIKMEVDQLLKHVVGFANARDVNGEYIFSGDVPKERPFQWDPSSQSYEYQGGINQSKLAIDVDRSMATGSLGQDIFGRITSVSDSAVALSGGKRSLFDMVQELSGALEGKYNIANASVTGDRFLKFGHHFTAPATFQLAINGGTATTVTIATGNYKNVADLVTAMNTGIDTAFGTTPTTRTIEAQVSGNSISFVSLQNPAGTGSKVDVSVDGTNIATLATLGFTTNYAQAVVSSDATLTGSVVTGGTSIIDASGQAIKDGAGNTLTPASTSVMTYSAILDAAGNPKTDNNGNYLVNAYVYDVNKSVSSGVSLGGSITSTSILNTEYSLLKGAADLSSGLDYSGLTVAPTFKLTVGSTTTTVALANAKQNNINDVVTALNTGIATAGINTTVKAVAEGNNIKFISLAADTYGILPAVTFNNDTASAHNVLTDLGFIEGANNEAGLVGSKVISGKDYSAGTAKFNLQQNGTTVNLTIAAADYSNNLTGLVANINTQIAASTLNAKVLAKEDNGHIKFITLPDTTNNGLIMPVKITQDTSSTHNVLNDFGFNEGDVSNGDTEIGSFQLVANKGTAVDIILDRNYSTQQKVVDAINEQIKAQSADGRMEAKLTTSNTIEFKSKTIGASSEIKINNTLGNFLKNMGFTDGQKGNLYDKITDDTLSDLDAALDSVIQARANVGARLNSLERHDLYHQDFILDMKTVLSNIEDLDYAEAMGRFNMETVALQAAQQTYAKIQSLSLFNYF